MKIKPECPKLMLDVHVLNWPAVELPRFVRKLRWELVDICPRNSGVISKPETKKLSGLGVKTLLVKHI